MTSRLCAHLMMTALLGATAFGQAAASVDGIFRELAADHAPGCAVGATRGDRPLVAKAFGLADLEHGVPLTPQSVFYMASVSKPFMALSILHRHEVASTAGFTSATRICTKRRSAS